MPRRRPRNEVRPRIALELRSRMSTLELASLAYMHACNGAVTTRCLSESSCKFQFVSSLGCHRCLRNGDYMNLSGGGAAIEVSRPSLPVDLGVRRLHCFRCAYPEGMAIRLGQFMPIHPNMLNCMTHLHLHACFPYGAPCYAQVRPPIQRGHDPHSGCIRSQSTHNSEDFFQSEHINIEQAVDDPPRLKGRLLGQVNPSPTLAWM